MNRKSFYQLIVLATTLALGACASQNVSLQKAIADYTAASQDERIVRNAPMALEDARTALNQAKKASEEADINTLSYVAQKRVEIARLQADRRTIEEKQAALRVEGKEKIMGSINELNQQNQALEKEVKDLKAKTTARGLEMTFPEGALFEVGKSDLKPGAEKHLGKIALVLKDSPERSVLVEGHTDSTGSADMNKKLSDKRAEAVGNYLESQGVPQTHIMTKGYGKSFPVAPNNTAMGRQQNRRVEVVILKQGDNPEKYVRAGG